MWSAARLGLLYALFVALATAANLASQWLTLLGAGRLGFAWGTTLFPALIVGTGVGLIVKYLLDKRYIFADRSRGISAHAKRFSLYTMMGVFTTAIFWAAELVGALIDPAGNLIYVGGAIGLTIGYVTKYCLDRKYVFTPMTVAETNP